MHANAKVVIFLTVLALVVFAFSAVAFAYDEPGNMPEDHTADDGTVQNCRPCHPADPSGRYCAACHAPHSGPTSSRGPHGQYATTTTKCSLCHSVHDAGGAILLPAATITGSCNTCHDGTGGKGVYGAIFARTGIDPQESGGGHAVDTTAVVPGGDAASGGSATMALGGVGGTLGCDDCHSPHDSLTVKGYLSERWRTTFPLNVASGSETNKLLRQHPGDTTGTAVTDYGSDWCISCHQGRASGGAVHNHPADSKATTTTPFVYANVAILDADGPTSVTVTGTLAGSNRGYLMPYPRTPEQGAHLPICQQCHEDSRYVGTLTDDVGAAAPFSVTATDGNEPADNPQFQNFPHEAVNYRMLVEADATSYYDDLCLNCHPVSQLP